MVSRTPRGLHSMETVRAVLEGRPELVCNAARLDPKRIARLTLDQIDALCQDLLHAHSDLIQKHCDDDQ